MARPALEVRLDLLNVVTVRAWRGGGWEEGERHLRVRDGKLGEELRGPPTYHRTLADALYAALRRVDLILATVGAPSGASELLGRTAGLSATLAASVLGAPGAALADARARSGLTRSALAERSGVDRSTIYRIETGRIESPRAETLARLLAAVAVGEQEGER